MNIFMTLTQHAHIYRLLTSNFNFGQFIFLFFLSMQPLPGVRHHGGCRTMAAAMVDRAWFS